MGKRFYTIIGIILVVNSSPPQSEMYYIFGQIEIRYMQGLSCRFIMLLGLFLSTISEKSVYLGAHVALKD